MFFCGSSSAAEGDIESENGFSSPSRMAKRAGNPFSSRGLDKFAMVSADLKTRAQGIVSQLGASQTDDLIVRFAHSSSEGWVPIVVKPKKSPQTDSDPHQKTSSAFPVETKMKKSNLLEKTNTVSSVKAVAKTSKVHDQKYGKPNIKSSQVTPVEEEAEKGSKRRAQNDDFPDKICMVCAAKGVKNRAKNAENLGSTSSLEVNDEKGVGVGKERDSIEREAALEWFGFREVDYRPLALMAIFLCVVVFGRIFAIVAIPVLWYIASERFSQHGKMIPKENGGEPNGAYLIR